MCRQRLICFGISLTCYVLRKTGLYLKEMLKGNAEESKMGMDKEIQKGLPLSR